jgi:protoheme IX farnesyltransferase
VIGWAAVTGTAPAEAWLLFALIFIWTPPHFWALSLYASEDYARAKVPMLPGDQGPGETRRQILIYSVVLAVVGVLPAVMGPGGPVYAVAAVAGGAMFLLLAWRVFRSRAGDADARGEGLYDAKAQAKPARDLFAYSIVHLFGLFAVLLAERLWGMAA